MSGFSRQWFEDFVATSRGELGGYLRRILNSADDVLEVSQEAYLKVYVALRKTSERPHSPRALLYATARSLAVSRLRHRQVVDRSAVAVTVNEEINARHSNPEKQAGQTESIEELMAVIRSLPPRRRAVIWLRLAEGLSQKEIAARLDISTSTVEKHLAQGLVQCREGMRRRTTVAALEPPAERLDRSAGS